MNKLPVNLIARYTAFLVANGIDTNQHRFYLKWLRYYLDFCTNYSFNWSEFDSLPAFVIKLKSKNQQPFLVDQAKKAVGLLWAMEKTKGTNQVETVKAPEKFSRSYKNRNRSPGFFGSLQKKLAFIF